MTIPAHLHDPAPSACAAADLAFQDHDHAGCAQAAMLRAEALVSAKGLRMTPVRKRVLQILLEAHQALGAYDVLNRLAAEGFGNQPPVVYRALDFLEEQGLAHRIRRLNAFVACLHAGVAHAPVFLICDGCKTVAEAPGASVGTALAAAASALDFSVDRATIEAVGLCPACRIAA